MRNIKNLILMLFINFFVFSNLVVFSMSDDEEDVNSLAGENKPFSSRKKPQTSPGASTSQETLKQNNLIEIISKENTHNNLITSPIHRRLVILYGTSSSGKTSIGRELERMGWVHMELDNFCSKKLFNTVKKILPHDYETCKKYLTKIGMLHVFLGNSQRPKYIAPLDSEETSLCSISITNILNKLGDIFNEVSLSDILQEITERSLRVVSKGSSVVLDAFLMQEQIDAIKVFLRDYPATFVLNYCPFNVLCDRNSQRNIFAHTGNLDEFRSPTMVIEQFLHFYRPRRHLREVNLGMLSREEVISKNRHTSSESIEVTCDAGNVQDLALKKFNLTKKRLVVVSTDFFPDYILNSEKYEPQDCAKFIIEQEVLRELREIYRKSFSAQLADFKAFHSPLKNQKSLFILMGTSSSGKSSLLEEFAKNNPSIISLKTRDLGKKMVFEHLRQSYKEGFDTLYREFGDSLSGLLSCSLESSIIIRKFRDINNRDILITQLGTLQNFFKLYMKELSPKISFLIPELVRKILSLGRDVVLDNVPKQDLSPFTSMNPYVVLVYCPFDKLSSRINMRNSKNDVLDSRMTLIVYEEFASFFRSKEMDENIRSLDSLKKRKVLSYIDTGFETQFEEGDKLGSLQQTISIEELINFKRRFLQNMGLDKTEKIEVVTRNFQPNFIINTSHLTPRDAAISLETYIRWNKDSY